MVSGALKAPKLDDVPEENEHPTVFVRRRITQKAPQHALESKRKVVQQIASGARRVAHSQGSRVQVKKRATVTEAQMHTHRGITFGSDRALRQFRSNCKDRRTAAGLSIDRFGQ